MCGACRACQPITMDFFVDGSFQQLFSDLEEQDVEVTDWQLLPHYGINNNNSNNSVNQNDINKVPPDDYIAKLTNYENNIDERHNMQLEDNFVSGCLPNSTHIAEEEMLQQSLDYLLSSSYSSVENMPSNDKNLPSMMMLNEQLSEWEEKFLDNFVEIPELVDFLPDKTPLCNDNCEDFLQESSENLRLHPAQCMGSVELSHDAEKSYCCQFRDCSKAYTKPAHLKAHLRRHMGEKPYVCSWPNCTWKFSRSDELARHRRSHSGIKPYKCDFCNKCFARSDHLTKHRKVHERRLLAANKAGKTANGILPQSVLCVRPGRKRKNQL
uniref:C2H2-type domain-containing protein n=1 Tax=Glossina austeni TaxID=7395 RepID=A0A1A9VC70_GLOAU